MQSPVEQNKSTDLYSSGNKLENSFPKKDPRLQIGKKLNILSSALLQKSRPTTELH